MGVHRSVLVLMGLFACFLGDDSLRDLQRTGLYRKACPKYGNAIQPSNRIYTKERVEALRALMVNTTITRDQRYLDAYLIPSQDEHQSEFVEDYDKRLQFISGFSGSYGDAVVTTNRTTAARKKEPSAVLWTDGRYHLQADNQIDCGWKLMRENLYFVPNITQWLQEDSPEGGVMGADPKLLSQYKWEILAGELASINWHLVEIHANLIDLLWVEGREPRKNKDVFVLGEEYAGKKWSSKVKHVRALVKRMKADAMVVTALDEIGWLLNIRGRDVPLNPFVRSYVILEMQQLRFYVNKEQLLQNNIAKYLKGADQAVEIFKYDQICLDLASRSQTYTKILIPSEGSVYSLGASRNISNCIPEKKRLFKQSPIILLKAKKNPTEAHGMQKAHIRDAAAMCAFFGYFEDQFKSGTTFTELDVVRIVNQFRYEQLDCQGNSFPTIAAYGANGALPHYVPTNSTNVKISDDSTLMLDSGGQYKDGTTDITRTIHFGVPTKEQKEAYTRVLIGQIQLASLTFPADLKTSAIDVLARAPLWEVGLDYDHSTGHGIGSFSSVHEAPILLYYKNPSSAPENEVLKPGYFLSNEPGYYREGDFGVRLENVMEVVEKNWLQSIHGKNPLGFRVVTLVPYEPKLIDLSLLSVQQIRWLNKYNDKIRIHVGEELKRQHLTAGFRWMMEKTNHFPEGGTGRVEISALLVLFYVVLVLLV